MQVVVRRRCNGTCKDSSYRASTRPQIHCCSPLPSPPLDWEKMNLAKSVGSLSFYYLLPSSLLYSIGAVSYFQKVQLPKMQLSEKCNFSYLRDEKKGYENENERKERKKEGSSLIHVKRTTTALMS